jgi:FKBP-type peptidyl-prolyl cis-trans isomerase
MRRKWINGSVVSAVVLLAGAAVCTTGKTLAEEPDKAAVTASTYGSQPSPVLKTAVDKMSYSYGVEIAKGLKRQGVEFNPEAMAQGMKDVLAGEKLLMSDEELRTMVATLQSEIRSKQARAKLTTGLDNKQKGDAFLAENKTKEGVVTLPSGLQYKVLKPGSGPRPKDGDIVECYYRGTLIDGTEFDSSSNKDNEGEPVPFKVSQVIPGWREALKLMPVNSRWQLFVPPGLAYGQRGMGNKIGSYSTLIFEIELVAIK